MYKTTNIVIKKDSELTEYFSHMCLEAKLFKNSVIFRYRQLLSASRKGFTDLQEHEQAVLDEFKQTEGPFKAISKQYYLPGYKHFDYLFKVTKNPDYYNSLPMQSSQQIIKEVLQSFKGFFNASKTYKKNPSGFTGKPKLPGYIQFEETSFDITNQDAVIKAAPDGIAFLKLPKTKLTVYLSDLKLGKLKEVTVKPYYDTYKICIVTEEPDPEPAVLDKDKYLSIDLGIDNFIATSNNCGLSPFVIKGNVIKSYNQWFNKKVAFYQGLLPKGIRTSRRIQHLWKNRKHKTEDFYNKAASYVVKYCISNRIGNLVIGKNIGWKQEVNIGKANTQNFCFISHIYFVNKLTQMAERVGIQVVTTEESYTSKASFLDSDEIPVYGEDKPHKFSGKRIYRGLYRSKEGLLINSDVNGASNILKKAVKTAFDKITDFSYLYQTTLKVNP